MGPPDRAQRRLLTDEDAELVAQAQGGDQGAFEELVRRHADGLYAVVLPLVADPHEAEEVTQEAFLRAWRGIRGFRGEARFFTWLYRIGVNEARRRARRGRPAAVRLGDERDDPPDPRPAPDCQVEHADLRAALKSAVRTLDPRYRAPLILRDIEGLSTADAAAVLGLGEAAFKSRLHRGRLAVRSALEAYLNQDGT